MKSTIKNSLFKSKIIAFSFFGIGIAAGSYYLGSHKTENAPEIEKLTFTENSAEKNIVLSEFNPNELSAEQWQKLGFSEKQSATILKYKNIVGGEFLSKKQLKKCYAISDEKFAELDDFILLPEETPKSSNSGYGFVNYSKSSKKGISVHQKFNPDLYSQQDWENLGFSEKQSAAIIKYRDYLGGSFHSKEKFRECFIINEENYRKLAPFLMLPEKSKSNETRIFKTSQSQNPKLALKNFDPNTLDVEGWKDLGFSEKQANVILNYKTKNLRGSFHTLDEIKSCFVISEEKFTEIAPFIQLNRENFTERKTPVYAKTELPAVKSDFTKIDINQITYEQLVEFGFTQKVAAGFVTFRSKLGGFINKNQVFETYDIDRQLAEKLNTTCLLKTEKVEKYTLLNAPESWLKTHPYFRYSADKIIYYRQTNDNEKKIWKMMNVKPEYVAKMKLYLK